MNLINLNLFRDTAGQEKFRSITRYFLILLLKSRQFYRSYYRNTVGIIIVYDITKRHTFDSLPDWIAEAEAHLGGPDPSKTVFLLVGHKADLTDQREVLFEEGEYFAKHKGMKFIETSAITGANVNVSYI